MLLAPPADPVRGPDQVAYTLAASWSQSKATLSGTEIIRFRNNTAAPLKRIWLRHWPNGWRGVGSIKGSAGCGKSIASLRVTHGRLRSRTAGCTAYGIDLDKAIAPGARGMVRVAFKVRVPRADDRFGRIGKFTNLGNAVPVLAIRDQAGWHLERYSSVGESFYTLSADWNATLKLPRGYRAATTGRVTGTRKGALVIQASRARDFAMSIGPYRVLTAQVGSTLLRLSSPTTMRAATVQQAMVFAKRALTTYEQRLGPYGAPELDLVLGSFESFGGMEYPQMVLTLPEHGPVYHEIAHQWFYGILGNDERREPWLDESFASWAEHDISGFDPCPTPPVPVVPGIFLDSSMDVFDKHRSRYGQIVYKAGACALDQIAKTIGRDEFRAILAGYIAAHRDGVVTKADFIAALRAGVPAGFDVDAWARGARLRLG